MSVCKVVRRGAAVWQVQIVRSVDGKRERVRRYFRRKDEAVLAEAELRAGVAPKQLDAAAAGEQVPTLKAFADRYLATDARKHNRPRTVREKEGMLRRGLLPKLGHLRLDAIKPMQIDEYQAQRLDEGMGPKTVNEEVGLLIRILRVAMDWEVIARVPRTRKLRLPPAEFDFLTFEEGERLIAAARDLPDPWGPMILTAIRTGLRSGELRGLRWQDVDLRAGRIMVRVAADDRGELHPPKNNRPREVPLCRDVLETLRSHRHLRSKHVFCNEDGSLLSQRQVDRPLELGCRRAGLRAVGWHVLRHTFASHLVMRGATLKAVQELMGHATMQMTMRYAHLSPDVPREAVALLDQPAPRDGATTEGAETQTAP